MSDVKKNILVVEDEDASDAWVDDPVMALAKQLGDVADSVETVRRIGFRFKGPDS